TRARSTRTGLLQGNSATAKTSGSANVQAKLQAETKPAGAGANSKSNTENARLLLKQARVALNEGKIDEAKKLTEQARALKPDLNWYESDTPDKLTADIQRASAKSGVASKAPAGTTAVADDPRVLLKQGRDLLAAGKL